MDAILMVMGMSRLVQINSRLVAVVNLTHQSIAKPSETNKVQVLYSSNGLLRLPPYLVISLFPISGLFLSP